MATKKYLDFEGLATFKALCDEAYAINGALVFKGTRANIAALPTVSGTSVGDMYNVTTGGETTSDFVEGAGKTLLDGDNVVAVNVAGSGEPAEMKWDILGGVLDVSGKLSYGDSFPADPEDEEAFLYLGPTTYTYEAVTPEGTENPQALGWYESNGATPPTYTLTSDTTVDAGKTYYERTGEEYVHGAIYRYDESASDWIIQSSNDEFVAITDLEIQSLFA